MRTLIIIIIAALACLTACKKDEARTEPAQVKAATPRLITLEVTGDGFQPDNIALKANEPVKFVVTRKTDETCATDLLIEGTDIKVALPLNSPVEIAWTPAKAGKVKFGCAMDYMVGGMLVID